VSVTGVDFCAADPRASQGEIVTSDYANVRVWNADGAPEPVILARRQHAATVAVFNGSGDRAAAAFACSAAETWNFEGAEPGRTAAFDGRLIGAGAVTGFVDFSPDGDRLLTVSLPSDWQPLPGECGPPPREGRYQLREWDLDNPDEPLTVTDHNGRLTKAFFRPPSSDREQIVGVPGLEDAGLRSWPTQVEGTAQGPGAGWSDLEDWDKGVNHAAFSTDGELLVTAMMDPRALVGKFGTGKSSLELEHREMVEMAVFGPDDERVATASTDGYVRLFDIRGTGKLSATRQFAANGDVTSVDFHWNGQRLLGSSTEGEARIWNVDGIGEEVVLRPDDAPEGQRTVLSAQFSPRGSPLGERVLTASRDGQVRLWRYRWADLVEALDQSTRLCLSKDERTRYLGEDPETAASAAKDCVDDKRRMLHAASD
jgi:WD40 repeat protein